jgi:hypothetical protein
MEVKIKDLPDLDNFDLSGFIPVDQASPERTVKWNLAEVKGILGIGSFKRSFTSAEIQTAGGVSVPFSIPLPPGSWSLILVSAILKYNRAMAVPAFSTVYMRYVGTTLPFASVTFNIADGNFYSYFKILDVNGNMDGNFLENADIEMYTDADSPGFDGTFDIILFGQAAPSPL